MSKSTYVDLLIFIQEEKIEAFFYASNLTLTKFRHLNMSFEVEKKDLLNIKLQKFEKLIAKYDSIKEEIYPSLSDKDFEAFENKITTCNVLHEDLESHPNQTTGMRSQILNLFVLNILVFQ
ncbi:hypothetical protein JTE90_021140 [Oedothorax gibbosus]|uniref:Uncharacterized protein n=1 Tax=Oedothorax gibbosus TaxID=931172 RepID=A0AAV6U058_9ARAC|nr:hypothetical protein JTE90_021140 [Oedothorax gibbosus]